MGSPAFAESECGAREYECSPEPDEAILIQHCCYVNRDGHEEHAPSLSKAGIPRRASALCRNGYYSFSEHRDGTCSHRHGVQSWIKTAAS